MDSTPLVRWESPAVSRSPSPRLNNRIPASSPTTAPMIRAPDQPNALHTARSRRRVITQKFAAVIQFTMENR